MDLTPEEKALIIQALLKSALGQPLWAGLVDSIFKKLDIEKEAGATFEHYKHRAQAKLQGITKGV